MDGENNKSRVRPKRIPAQNLNSRRDILKTSNIKSFPQEPLHWKAWQETYFAVQRDPSPTNQLIAKLVAQAWKQSFLSEEHNG